MENFERERERGRAREKTEREVEKKKQRANERYGTTELQCRYLGLGLVERYNGWQLLATRTQEGISQCLVPYCASTVCTVQYTGIAYRRTALSRDEVAYEDSRVGRIQEMSCRIETSQVAKGHRRRLRRRTRRQAPMD